MITFTLCLLALVAGYFIYGRFIEHVFRTGRPQDSCYYQSRRGGLYPAAYVENLCDTVPEYRRSGTLRCNHGERNSVRHPICG